MNPPRPLLYTYRRCPYAMRARMALLWAGVTFDAHEIVLRHKPAALLAASPKGTVPVLVLPGGQVIEQSWDIVAWALNQPGSAQAVQDLWQRAQTPANRELLLINDGEFKRHLDRFKYPQRFADLAHGDVPGVREHHRRCAVETLLEKLEARLTQTRFLGGDQACATDIAIFPFVRQFAAVDRDAWSALPLPRVRAWSAHWQQTPLFEACMQKQPSDVVVTTVPPPATLWGP